MKILIIEDDQQLAHTIKEALKNSCVIDIATTGENGEYLATINDYDCIVVDLKLPDTDGMNVCKNIREAAITTPILILTGTVDIGNKVLALDLGADDYLTKPFHFPELHARLRALSRRNPTPTSSKLVVEDLVLDMTTNKVNRAQKEISLRRKELLLLEYLMRNPGKVLTRAMILEHVWESDQGPLTNTVDVHINYLRRKIDIPFPTHLITTVPGLGYKIGKDAGRK